MLKLGTWGKEKHLQKWKLFEKSPRFSLSLVLCPLKKNSSRPVFIYQSSFLNQNLIISIYSTNIQYFCFEIKANIILKDQEKIFLHKVNFYYLYFSITADRERQKALAKERLEALRHKKQQRSTQENLEQKLREENENNKLLDAEESSGK